MSLHYVWYSRKYEAGRRHNHNIDTSFLVFDKNRAIHYDLERFNGCHSFSWRLCKAMPVSLTGKQESFYLFRLMSLRC